MKMTNDAGAAPPQSNGCTTPEASGSENAGATVPSGNIEEAVSDMAATYHNYQHKENLLNNARNE
jgi:hypothetical protein